jgi:hypothetical protein
MVGLNRSRLASDLEENDRGPFTFDRCEGRSSQVAVGWARSKAASS